MITANGRMKVLAGAMLGMFVSGVAVADVSTIASGCNDCHGDGGVSQWTDVPTIAGIPPLTQEDALFAYMDEMRPCVESDYRQGDTSRSATTMCAVVGELSEDDIVALAEHYSAMDFVPAKQDFDAALAEKGKAVHEEYCEKCHTEGGSNPEDEASILAGQWKGYLTQTMGAYRSGEREQPKSMKSKMDELSDEDVAAVIEFYASQQ